MTKTRFAALMASSLLLAAPVLAEGWMAAPQEIEGRIRAGSRDEIVAPGQKTSIEGMRMTPGQTVQILHGTRLLTADPVTVAEDGKFSFDIDIPADAEIGTHPLTVVAANPAGVQLVDLKLSREIPASGEAGFTLTPLLTTDRAYQVALSPDGKLYVASARGAGGPGLTRYDAATLSEEATAELPKDSKGEPMGAFGLGVDPNTGNVWATDTMNDTVVIYDAGLKPLKVLPEGLISHPRDVVFDAQSKRAYVNAGLTGKVTVFDTETFEVLPPVWFHTPKGREVMASMSMELDAENHRLYTASRETPFVGWIDLTTGEAGGWEVPAARGASDIARDPETGRFFVVSQNSDNVVVLDDTGAVLADTPVGAGAVSVAFDPATRHAYVAARAAGTLAVVDTDGKIVANLPLGDLPNHVVTDGKGTVFALAMLGPKDDSEAGSVTKITAK